MQKVHLISVAEPLMFHLALAVREKGYEVSASDEGLDEAAVGKLRAAGCACSGAGWYPEKLTKNIQCVVLGSRVKPDNPELLHAQQMGLLIQLVPEYIFQWTKDKTRVVVSGSRGKKTVLSMIIRALQRQKLEFDYAFSSHVPILPDQVRLSYESRIALIEGDEHRVSVLEQRSQLEYYRPHIAILTNLSWSAHTGHPTQEDYLSIYRSFSTSIEREGKLIYYGADPAINYLVKEVREDITAMPYEPHAVMEKDGTTFLQTRYGDYPIRIPNKLFLININAARLACRQLGVKDADFYQALSEYSLSLPL